MFHHDNDLCMQSKHHKRHGLPGLMEKNSSGPELDPNEHLWDELEHQLSTRLSHVTSVSQSKVTETLQQQVAQMKAKRISDTVSEVGHFKSVISRVFKI